MNRWTDPERQIIKDNLSLGSKKIADVIKEKIGTSRTYRAVRAEANRMGVHIKNIGGFKPVLGMWLCRGKWRTRINGRQVTLGREGLRPNEVRLADGHVVTRAELMRLNRYMNSYHSCEDDKLKELMRIVVQLDQKVFESLGKDHDEDRNI